MKPQSKFGHKGSTPASIAPRGVKSKQLAPPNTSTLIFIVAGVLSCSVPIYGRLTAKKLPPPSSIFEGTWAVEQNPSCDSSGKFYRITPNSLELLNHGRIANVTDKLEVTEDPKAVRVEAYFRNEERERILVLSISFDRELHLLRNRGFEITDKGRQLFSANGLSTEKLTWALDNIGDLRRC